jgi:hypothetical protein
MRIKYLVALMAMTLWKIYAVHLVLLNIFMKKHEIQYQSRTREKQDTIDANKWLAQNGFDAGSFAKTNVRLLKAQQQANALLATNRDQLSKSQLKTLESFVKKMMDKAARTALKPKAANEVFKIKKAIQKPDSTTRTT